MEVVEHVKKLGADIVTGKRRVLHTPALRIEKSLLRIPLVTRLPCGVSRDCRAAVLASAMTTEYSFGAEQEQLPVHPFRQLRTAVITCLWGSRRALRSVTALFAVVLQGHLLDPQQVMCYRATHSSKTPGFETRIQELATQEGQPMPSMAPVMVFRSSLRRLGWRSTPELLGS